MIYHFGTCRLDSRRVEFCRDGEAVHLEPQVWALLHLLVRRAGEVIGREELVAQVWRGLNVSDATISARIAAARRAVGDDGRAQRVIRTVQRRGIQLVAEVREEAGPPPPRQPLAPGEDSAAPTWTPEQTVRFLRSSRGARIACAQSGSGPPLVRLGHWLSHLELDRESPVWRPLLERLSQGHRLIRYDQRGTGLSSRDLDGAGLEDFVQDLEAVAEGMGLDRFPIFAASQAVPVAVSFAARHPARVSGMVLYGGFATGRAMRPAGRDEMDEDTVLKLIRAGWGRADSPFMQAFSHLFVPDASPEQLDSLVRMQLHSVSPEGAAQLRRIIDGFRVEHLLGGIAVPTLVIHARDDAIQPVDQGRLLASEIPGARFVLLDSRNHIPLPQEPSWSRMMTQVLGFIDSLQAAPSGPDAP